MPGSNVTLDYNDSAGTVTIASTAAGGTGLTAEQVRDTIAAFAVAGENITIEHRDADNQLIFNADASLDTLGTVIICDTNGALILLNRADSSRSVTLGNLATLSNQFSAGDNLNGLTYHEGVLYAVARSTRRVFAIDLHTSPISVTLEGTLPTLLANVGGMASHEGTVYIARSGTGSQALWSGDPTNPSGFTRVGFLPSGFENSAGIASHGGKLYGVNANTTDRGIYEIDTTDPAGDTVRLGTMPSGAGAQFGMFSVSGNLYTVTDVGGLNDEWWQVDLADIPNSYRVGTFPSTNVGGAAVAEGIITTTVIPEGVNLYYTNARADARIDNAFDFDPSGDADEQLLKLDYDGTTYQVRSTFAVKYLSDRPVADEDTLGHVYHVLKEAQTYIGVEDSHQSAVPSGTFNNVPNRSDLHIVANLPTNLNNLSTGDFYYHAGGDPARGGYEFYEVVVRGTKQLENVHASRALAASRSNNSFNITWLGSNADSTEALAFTDAISSTTNYFFHNETTDRIQRLDNTTYSGPSVQSHYRWLGIGGGGGGTEDGIADSLAFAVSGQDVTATLGRSVGADLTASFTVPGGTDNYADSVDLSVSAGDLILTLGRTGSLADLTSTVTLFAHRQSRHEGRHGHSQTRKTWPTPTRTSSGW